MDLLLRQEADRAKDIAECLNTVRDYDKDHVQDLTVTIQRLNALSWALRELDHRIGAVGGRLNKGFIDDLRLLQLSVAFTLQDVWTILGKIPRHAVKIDYLTAWWEVGRYCHDMGKRTLTMRLNIYELFAYGLCKILLRQSHNRDHIDNLRHQIFDLQTQQLHGRRLIALTENFNTLSLVPVQQAGAHILPAMF
ncbi:hypothetical protein LTR10_020590 [Elasticomyces elasticus]|uniref:Fungal N-terminal domain-containing protein n=1 Tax=Exophiala sideris TaxID=1016849 RepID=A0ABR0JK54_9EURO|nr:hypothetical protein LTR10_020590 [Elasticomyces elasticus]KAK5035445.1 hypothetical protein LTS07_002883 [Exophiala sideris]KAK5039204.1 hypothetical protein LTR13_003460 [Exophiala sideris]KAK5066370.1 hypothetical protein LTR69_002889 [Exophiala sideris]KAK5187047.1 hypothetical protein LTR44_001054 [Eurotiomycetes sp. CCFEE 6388]